jgi:hypothetical protein
MKHYHIYKTRPTHSPQSMLYPGHTTQDTAQGRFTRVHTNQTTHIVSCSAKVPTSYIDCMAED